MSETIRGGSSSSEQAQQERVDALLVTLRETTPRTFKYEPFSTVKADMLLTGYQLKHPNRTITILPALGGELSIHPDVPTGVEVSIESDGEKMEFIISDQAIWIDGELASPEIADKFLDVAEQSILLG